MHIAEDHLYYGAAVIQIAEDESFTAINDYREKKKIVECTYLVNNNIGLYLKYRLNFQREYLDEKQRTVHEYQFQFTADVRALLSRLHTAYNKTFLGLICPPDREICCLPYSTFMDLVKLRIQAGTPTTSEITINVALLQGGKFRVFVTPPGKRGQILNEPILIARKDFPSNLFV